VFYFLFSEQKRVDLYRDFFDENDMNQGANYKKILRLSYDVIITYDNRKSNLR